jgi:hypothetical protein
MTDVDQTAATPFDDIRRLVASLPGPDRDAVAMVAERDATLTKPAGSLGRLEHLVSWLAAWQGKGQPTLDRPLVCVFAGSHGVTARGVSAFPDAVNRQMLDNFAAGGGAINQICAAYGLGFKVFDLAIDMPTGDITVGPAFDEKACVATMAFGGPGGRGRDQHQPGLPPGPRLRGPGGQARPLRRGDHPRPQLTRGLSSRSGRRAKMDQPRISPRVGPKPGIMQRHCEPQGCGSVMQLPRWVRQRRPKRSP